jgi:hypothetical protein
MNTRNGTSFTQSDLILSTNYISTSLTIGSYPVSNSIGTINAGKTEYTWYSVDLSQVLGDQYNKFEYFNLVLRCVQYGTGVGAFNLINVNEKQVSIVASGPSWVNSSYDVGKRRSTAEATIGAINVPNSQSYTVFFDNCLTTFRKTPTFDFTIKLITLKGTPPDFVTSASMFPYMTFYFDIIPVQYPEPEKYAQVY